MFPAHGDKTMALATGTIFEVQFLGDNDNGGGFNPNNVNGAGTDYSQATAAHVTFDGSTITATTSGASATMTLSGYTVSTADRGNLLRITGGTNFVTSTTPYEVVQVNVGANTWTLDRNVSTGAASGLLGKMGGAVNSIGRIIARVPLFSKIWVKADAPHNITNATLDGQYSEIRPPATAGRIEIEGYDATRGDRTGTKPSFRAIVPSRTLVNYGSSGNMLIIRNCEFDGVRGGAGTGSIGVQNGGDNAMLFEECHFKSFASIAINGAVSVNMSCHRCTFTDNVLCCGSVTLNLSQCEFYANVGSWVLQPAGGVIERCLFSANTSSNGVITGATGSSRALVTVDNCDFYGNTGAALVASQSTEHLIIGENCACVNSSAYGFDGGSGAVGSSEGILILRNCAGYNNASGDVRNAYSNSGFITLTGNPFTAAGSDDFSLNSTAGAGAALTAAGYAPTFPRGLTSASAALDVGAWQGVASSPPPTTWGDGVRFPYQTTPG
jgi:hypothetical protein